MLAFNQCTGQEILCIRNIIAAASFFNTDFTEHLTNDNFNMLVVDINTLETVYFLYFNDNIILYSRSVQNFENSSGSNIAFGQAVTLLDNIPFMHFVLVVIGDNFGDFLTGFGVVDCECSGSLDFFKMHNTVNTCNDSRIFRLSGFKEFFNTGKTLCNITFTTGSDTACMESTHGQLCTRFTDGLCSNCADCFADRYQIIICKVCTIAFCADTFLGLAFQNGTDFDSFDTQVKNLLSIFFCQKLIFADDKFTSFSITQILTEETSGKSVLHFFN